MGAIREYAGLLRQTFKRWFDRNPFRNSTVLAYYTLFSLPGLLIITINIVGYFYGDDNVTEKITAQIREVIGSQVAKDVNAIIEAASVQAGNTFATIVGVAAILFGATGVFYHLQQTLNIIWEVKPKPKQRFLKLIRDRLFSFGMVLAIGFLLLVSFALSTLITVLSGWVTDHLSESLSVLFYVLDIILSLGIITFLFAAIFKYLPDVKILWLDVWGGAIITSILFIIAKFVLGFYFVYNDPGSAYGAAGSIILILLWVSYAGIILLFGAEFTQVHTRHFRSDIEISDYAVPMDDAELKEKNEELSFEVRPRSGKKTAE